MLMKIEQAIQKLIARNKNFVAKNGISDYSRETDEIINAILKLYHNQKMLQSKIDFNNKLFSLFEINDKDYNLPDIYLDFINQIKYDIAYPNQLDHIISRFKSIDNAIKTSYEQALFFLELIKNTDNKILAQYLKEELQKNDTYKYISAPYESILEILRGKYLHNLYTELYEQLQLH